MSHRYIKSVFFSLVLFAMAIPAVTNAASINSFTVGSNNYNSYQYASLVWSLSEAGKVSIFVSCQNGVKASSPDIGTAKCNSAFESTNMLSNDAMNLQVVNVSGNPQTITVTISPIDAQGVVQSSASQSVSFSVATVQTPITSFTATPTTITSYQPVTFTWASVTEVPGVNLSMECTAEVLQATTTIYSGTTVPCSQTISSTDLPANGSATFSFYTSSKNKIPITMRVYPAISTGVYDAMHGAATTINFENKQSAAPTVSSSNVNTDRVADMAPVQVSWKSLDSQAVNIRINCPEIIQAYIYATTTNTFVPARCGQLASDAPLATTGSTTLQFKNKGSYVEQVRVAVLPGKGDGTYDATVAKDMILNIYPSGVSTTQYYAPNTSTSLGIAKSPIQANNTFIKKINKKIYKSLYRGSSNSDVKELQIFLSQFKEIYPEASTTGYFGPATERAVKRFQEKYGIAKKGEAGYGSVGPKTRAKINEL